MNIASERSNLYYEVHLKPQSFYTELLKKLRSTDGATIIYRSINRSVEGLALKLKQDGILALPYHSGLSADQRTANRTQFLNNQARVIITTSFSGSDLYKPDVRLIIHYELPRTLHRYFQETGKAGRDGLPAQCILFCSYQDVRNIKKYTGRRTDLSLANQEEIYTDLQQVIDYVVNHECRLALLPHQPKARCGKCDNCSNAPSERDWTIDAQKFLSCIARFAQRGESFGANYAIEVLRGSTDEKIFRYKHHELSTYGKGTEKSAEHWRRLAQLLLFRGLVEEVQVEHYSILKLNDKSWEIMRNQRPVFAHSATWAGQSTPTSQKNRGRSYTLEFYRQGLSVAEIAQRQGYQEETILRHLADLILRGEPIDIKPFVSRHEQLEILQALKATQIKPLKTAYEYLGGRYKYGQISLVLAHWQQFGEPTQATSATHPDDFYEDHGEDPCGYGYDYLPEDDTSVDYGYLVDIPNLDEY